MNKKSKQFNIELFVVCDYAMFSQDGKLSLLGIFDRIFTKTLPANHPRMIVAATLVGNGNEECKVNIEFIAPDGSLVMQNQSPSMMVKLGPNGKGNVISEIVGFPIQTTGQYKIRMLINGESRREIPLYAQKVVVNEGFGKQPN
ncbi:MAG: hypothetical protein ACD_36C00103G0002 [uncultured bacterium]|uniref:DUF4469 domain-containing protein n=1 Tax=Candidatus Gottesmanbacteria bacterium RIFCSPLOWO2_01_FULL_43_11b TaxID=1798392 RepID=A0A1F6AHJ2_9BACT|nr:MAG: hypothetical protein ACD_36C00103G0002 [uncultured bacterium]OGG24210.1 MAG: hypothetical protein A3A79_03410 [Candidatus Gottesmanbacteria bacterium RIFCSPLOWO2_01_FULL_43_11b]